ncbi:MAG: hypothetical protein WKG03_04350, partial [Telluria sp.]
MRKTVVHPSPLLLSIFSTVLLSACGDGGTQRSATIDHTPRPAIAAATVVSEPVTLQPTVAPAASKPVKPLPPPVAVSPVPGGVPPVVVLAPPPAKPIVVAPVAPVPPVPVAPAPPVTLEKPPTFTFITDVTLESTRSTEQVRVPVTFGQVFAPGQVDAAHTISAKLRDGSTVALQVDAKARHADGSLRHAILSATLPRLGAGLSQKLYLTQTSATATAPAATPAALLDAGFSASVSIDLDGTTYSAAADKLLQSGRRQSWLAGPVANEWLVAAPLTTAQGAVHPHLVARFAVRAFGNKQARVDVTLENSWAFEASPSNFTYDAKIHIGGKVAYTKADLTHYHHARWRKVFWWGATPEVHVKHNTGYLIASKAVPNYDQSLVFAESTLEAMKTAWTGAKTEPMGVGEANPYMPATGGRKDIGLLPGWAATYLLSMDKRAKDVMLGTADL